VSETAELLVPAPSAAPEFTPSGAEGTDEATPAGSVGGRPKWSRRRAKAFLESCPTRTVMIERNADDKRYQEAAGEPAYQYCTWNGWPYLVPKGEIVAVPEPIAQLIDQLQDPFPTAQSRGMRTLLIGIGNGPGPQVTL